MHNWLSVLLENVYAPKHAYQDNNGGHRIRGSTLSQEKKIYFLVTAHAN